MTDITITLSKDQYRALELVCADPLEYAQNMLSTRADAALAEYAGQDIWAEPTGAERNAQHAKDMAAQQATAAQQAAAEALAKNAEQKQAEHTALRAQRIKDCDHLLSQYRNATDFGLPCNISKEAAGDVAAYQNSLYDWQLGEAQPSLPTIMVKK